MAQTGYTPISIYYSATSTNVPTAGNLVAGELAINTADGKLFYKDSAGVVQVIAGKAGAGVAGGSNTQVQYNSSGSLAGSANMTFSGTALTLANDASISTLTIGRGGSAVASNTALGLNALGSNTSGTNNTAAGSNALVSNTTGLANTAFGNLALAFNTTASDNTAVGYQAGYSNTTGTDGVFIGYQAGYTNTTAAYNVAVGRTALLNNSTGASNTAIGARSLEANTASFNTAIGYASSIFNTSGTNNLSAGYLSLYTNTTGSSNVALGVSALQSNTTASNNTAVGYQAGYSNTTGQYGTYIGYQAGYTGTTNRNTCVGIQAGYNSTGIQNNFFGDNAGAAMTTGTYNTILGSFQGNSGGLDIRTSSNYIVLSDGAGNPRGFFDNNGLFRINVAAADGQVSVERSGGNVITAKQTSSGGWCYKSNAFSNSGSYFHVEFLDGGTSHGSITSNGTNTTYSTSSDIRLKENVVDAQSALPLIDSVKIRSFDWIGKDKKQDFGVIAQELINVCPDAVVKGLTEEDTWGVDTSFLIPALIKAVQELKAEVDSLKQQLGK